MYVGNVILNVGYVRIQQPIAYHVLIQINFQLMENANKVAPINFIQVHYNKKKKKVVFLVLEIVKHVLMLIDANPVIKVFYFNKNV